MQYKPVLVAGFSICLTTISVAQDYIDVEAEREAARRGDVVVNTGTSIPVTINSVNNSVGNSVEGTVSGQSVTPNTPYSGSAGGDGTIRPYAGTTLPAPVITRTDPMPSPGGVVIQLQQLQAEVRRLNGIVEQQTQEIRTLKEQGLERYIDLDRRLAAFGVGDSLEDALVGTDQNTAGIPAVPEVNTPTAVSAEAQPGEEAMYRDAYELVKGRDFNGAVTGFIDFLDSYPFGKYAPNAHYWLGELYLVIEPADAELARQSFKLLLDQYPDNAKVPDALYKLGRVYYLKGNPERSREYLDRVIKEYGAQGHPAAQLAQDFIDQNF